MSSLLELKLRLLITLCLENDPRSLSFMIFIGITQDVRN